MQGGDDSHHTPEIEEHDRVDEDSPFTPIEGPMTRARLKRLHEAVILTQIEEDWDAKPKLYYCLHPEEFLED